MEQDTEWKPKFVIGWNSNENLNKIGEKETKWKGARVTETATEGEGEGAKRWRVECEGEMDILSGT